jgi:hypothetical protein
MSTVSNEDPHQINNNIISPFTIINASNQNICVEKRWLYFLIFVVAVIILLLLLILLIKLTKSVDNC